jgi:hypothetical protein
VASISANRQDLFPPGVTVAVYAIAGREVPASGAPGGQVLATALVGADGWVTFAGLDYATEYLLYAPPAKYLRVLAGGSPGPASDAGTGNARVLLWDSVAGAYGPAAYLSDTSTPREFVGPVDPATLPAVAGPVFGDRWTPTEEPAG